MNTQERIFHATSADGTRLGCVIDGAGPPLVLVHGTGDTHAGFRRIRPLLARHFTLYLMDRRGRGVSGDNEARLTAVAPGTTTLTVTAAGLSQSFPVEVKP